MSTRMSFADAEALSDSLDTLSSGMFLVDAAGKLVHVNASGHALIAGSNVLRRGPNGQLRAIDPTADRALLDSFSAAERGGCFLRSLGTAIPLTARTGARYIAHVLPLREAAHRSARPPYGAMAVVFVRRAELEVTFAPLAIAEQFKLTRAELRVLFSLIDSDGIAETAEILGISEGTARTHLHHVFEKTGTGRQAELVKLIAGYCLLP